MSKDISILNHDQSNNQTNWLLHAFCLHRISPAWNLWYSRVLGLLLSQDRLHRTLILLKGCLLYLWDQQSAMIGPIFSCTPYWYRKHYPRNSMLNITNQFFFVVVSVIQSCNEHFCSVRHENASLSQPLVFGIQNRVKHWFIEEEVAHPLRNDNIYFFNWKLNFLH